MEITKDAQGEVLNIVLSGRLDTTTAPQLEEIVIQDLNGVKELNFDFTDLAYVSSAGLRVLLAAQKTMKAQGNMVIKNVNESVKEVFDITGFADILTIV